ncbi:hypothetical protein [Pseudooceanicola marinus]|uniref:hypothetical protein n=1 Tax=Pseudooceanicola marinus TaxID=396013 RepID=UPI001CD7538E|nr:hypothetical protein [Pseudooceanicola marinus]MCA1338101.1 hypothetical protein [Pseudooceanicola marinus]
MADLNPSIILAGQPVNALNALSGGIQTAGQANDVRHTSNYRNTLAQYGAGAIGGDQGSINALAGFDPGAALGIQQTRQQMDILDAQERRAAAKYAASLSAARRSAVAQEVEGAVKVGLGLQDKDAWDAFMGENQPDLVGQFENRQALANRYMSVADILRNSREPDPIVINGQLVNPRTSEILGDYRDDAEPVSPDYVEMNGQLVDRNARGGPAVVPVQGLQPEPIKQTEADRELARMESIGIPRDVAIRIKEGVYRVVTDPLTRETSVMDLSSGKTILDATHSANIGPSPSGQVSNQTAPALSFGPDVSGDAGQSFGVEGFAKAGINALGDAVGLGPAYPDVQETQSDFMVLRETLLNDVAGAYDRQPPGWLMENIRDLTPEPGRPLQGASGAQSKLRALKRNFESELNIAQQQAGRRLSPTQRQDLETRIIGLEATIRRVDGALARFGSDQQQRTSNGITWSIE